MEQIKVLSLPANGTLKLSGMPVTGNQAIPVSDLGNLTFVPDANWNGNTSFSWNGSDGSAYAASAANVDITITAVPDVPVVSAIPKSGTEDTVLTFSTSDFTSHFSDPDGDSLTQIKIISLPSYGVLKLTGSDVIVDQEIVVGDLGDLNFVPDANWSGDTSFDWKGFDGSLYSNTDKVDMTINAEGFNWMPVIIGGVVVVATFVTVAGGIAVVYGFRKPILEVIKNFKLPEVNISPVVNCGRNIRSMLVRADGGATIKDIGMEMGPMC